jgi:hypothetical protein
MVYSNIHSSVFYKEEHTIDPEDVGHSATLFQMPLYEKMVLIVFGKVKHTFIDRNVVYFPIYLVSGGKALGQIGIVEMHKNKVLSVIDDGEVDVDQLPEPILFSFVNADFVDRSGSDADVFIEHQEKKEKEKEMGSEGKQVDADDLSDEEDAVMKVKVPKHKLSPELEKVSETLDAGIFVKEAAIVPPPLLEEETKEDLDLIKSDFKKRPSHVWVAKFMKNNGYKIHEVEANGDCFFAVIRDAYKQIGQVTTVAKLRAILAKEATDTIFQEYRTLFLALDATVREYDAELSKISETIKGDLKKRARKVRDQPEELQRILDQISELEAEFKLIQEKRGEGIDLIETSMGMNFKTIDTLEQFREFIQTPSFWANEWAISVMERALKMKVIILSQRSYLEENYDNVLNCGMANKELLELGHFEPKFYIMTTYSGDHYRLITYKDKRIFHFNEIPANIKSMVINKCMERNAGAFSIIQDFRNLKSKMGLEREGEADEEKEEEQDTDMYTPNICFAFHSTGNVSAKPGKGAGETIPEKQRAEFIDLGRMKQWRRKLDDAWTEAPFKIDGHKWASVEHYYQGSKFKKHFPNFMKEFAMDSGNKIAEDVDLARIAGSKTGLPKTGKEKKKVKEGVSLRPANVTIDPDFYGKRSEEEREIGVRAKFTQNADMREILLATKKAKLVHFVRGAKCEPDHILMKVRSELAH